MLLVQVNVVSVVLNLKNKQTEVGEGMRPSSKQNKNMNL